VLGRAFVSLREADKTIAQILSLTAPPARERIDYALTAFRTLYDGLRACGVSDDQIDAVIPNARARYARLSSVAASVPATSPVQVTFPGQATQY